ncbi:hypothetical protein P152DRAFT_224282 [Eremomyces bilateralis CBS 781.70]|uniref:HIT-type domain-containing protein n=1 Tax=Eremomyces bilateralis CBS 781.70 TaxID=1392243 RepID=A0A6G1FRL1_9PEZI|nr:uncharacterized protein P152DRAFT_224282 [Eremomyces bilateralis CBS 781.70]KAF1808368.1 hypothetical protein P152DRAFT_224282 [Eremomyces bilateralis CBS 781.70]
MPSIEVLPASGSASAPGWAYVPDTGYDPSKVPINPSGARKRAARNVPTASTGVLNSRQQLAIQRRIAELDRDNPTNVHIPVPIVHSRRAKPKTTPAVKKILQSQKTFANHLSDEEALLNLQQSSSNLRAALPSTRGKRSSLAKVSVPPTPTPPSASTPQPTPSSAAPESSASAPKPSAAPGPNATDLDREPLLAVSAPQMPSADDLEALLAEPPLSYLAARAAAPGQGAPPQRFFCEYCGYWGRVKCLRCGGRTCGLECKTVHDETCLRTYA